MSFGDSQLQQYQSSPWGDVAGRAETTERRFIKKTICACWPQCCRFVRGKRFTSKPALPNDVQHDGQQQQHIRRAVG